MWKGNANSRGVCKVSWDVVTLPNTLGGLNIKDLRMVNGNLLYKWLRKLRNSGTSLWWCVCVNRYGSFSWQDIERDEIKDLSHIQKGIFKVCVGNDDWWKLFKSNTSISIRDGGSSFWHDNWTSNIPLAELFPDLYMLWNRKRSSSRKVVKWYLVKIRSLGPIGKETFG